MNYWTKSRVIVGYNSVMFKACNSHLQVCEQNTGLFVPGIMRERDSCVPRLAAGTSVLAGVGSIAGSLLKCCSYHSQQSTLTHKSDQVIIELGALFR